jgi:hypothetical protein
MSSVTLFFSLPFTPVNNHTRFYNGHLAIAIDSVVYQIFDPAMLKCGFLVSRMPVDEWLYGESRKWCQDDRAEGGYSGVYLYGKGEALRTKVFRLDISCAVGSYAREIEDYFAELEKAYQEKKITYHPVRYNCATAILDILSRYVWLGRHPLDFLPAVVFRNVMRYLERTGCPYSVDSISSIQGGSFRVHAYCMGFLFGNAEGYFDRRIGPESLSLA